jgi:uncharacterized membrane protein
MHLVRTAFQIALGAALTYAGITHLTTSRTEFQAQVPTILESQADFVVIASGVVEILLGSHLSSCLNTEPALVGSPQHFSSQYFLATSLNTSTASMHLD